MPRIDTSTIDGYADMSAEEKLAALEAYEYQDGSEELSKYKSATTRANGEAAEYRRQLKEARARLEEAEAKADEGRGETEREVEKLKEQLAAMQHEKTVADYTARLASSGFDADASATAAKALADGDADAFFAQLAAFVEAHDKALRAEMAQHSIAPKTGNTDPDRKSQMTRKKLDRMSPLERMTYTSLHQEEVAGLR